MEKNRVAIVSFFKSENYGAILQASALQHAIEVFGYKPSYLDYIRKKNLSFLRLVLNFIYELIRNLLGYKRRRARTECFVRNNITIKQFNREDDFDVYVAGSDQIWFPGYVDDFFLLKFVKKTKKISYASSFGVNKLDVSYHNYYYDGLASYDVISTREKAGTEIVHSLGLKSTVVLDPTLLFSCDYWINKSVKPNKSHKYILCYVMNGDLQTARIVYQQAKCMAQKLNNGTDVIIIGDKEYKKLKFGYKLICDAGPSEFLGYINNAEFVFTSSFHGTCFSILFEKNFVNILRRDNPVNSRIEELDEMFGLRNRIIYLDSERFNIDFPNIDYRPIREKLKLCREESLRFLHNSLK